VRVCTAASLVGLVALGACAYDRPALGGDAEVVDDGPRPDGADGSAPDGAAPDSPSGDRDGDGFNNLDDNCPDLFNLHQDDADGDRIGDVCDLCPQRVNIGRQLNSDGDDLDDSCGDPDTGSRQCITWFDGFGDGRTLSSYTRFGGMWRIADGALVQTSPTASAYVGLQQGWVRPRVQTSVEILSLGSGPTTYMVGPATDVGALVSDEPDGYFARFNRGSTALRSALTINEQRSGRPHLTSTASATPLAIGVGVELVLDTRTPLLAVAELTGVEPPIVTSSVTAIGTTTADGGVGLFTVSLTARFDYFMVIADATDERCPPRVEP